ncbi:MAG TPA: hypothetical protein ENH50_03800 [Nitrospirae bacterium]|nr:chemotaxis protein CheW [bacterium BMS3Abin08]HDY70769.1 hypothetical protein [Nitrospirota bacterium]
MSDTQHIAFRLGREEFALPILNVQEIIRPRENTRIPESPEYILGVINLRGRVIPVVDLKKRMKLEGNGNGTGENKVIVLSLGKLNFGGVVDSITGVVNISEQEIGDSVSTLSSSSCDYIKGIATLNNGRMIQILQPSGLMSLQDMELLQDEIVDETQTEDGTIVVTKKVSGMGGEYLIKEVKEKIITDAESLGVGREVVVSIMEKIQGLLNALSKGDIEGAEGMLMEISTIGDKELFSEVGKITRNLHNAISEFKTMIDPTLKNMALEDMPDAADKLNWVISKTEEAAEKTISLVEKNLSLQGGIVKRLDILDDALKNPEGDNEREKEAITFLRRTTEEINVDLMDVLLTQEYQDLTGQIIRKVISLVSKLEIDLVQLIKAFGVRVEHQKHGSTADSEPPEETFSSQEDVDTLLTELGF